MKASSPEWEDGGSSESAPNRVELPFSKNQNRKSYETKTCYIPTRPVAGALLPKANPGADGWFDLDGRNDLRSARAVNEH